MAAGAEPKHQATRFALWSDARRAVFPGFFLFILFASITVGALLLFASRRATSRALGSAYEVVALVPVMALVQYLSVLGGEGEYEVEKPAARAATHRSLLACRAMEKRIEWTRSCRVRAASARTTRNDSSTARDSCVLGRSPTKEQAYGGAAKAALAERS
jgi:hypothetical protein